MSNREMEETWLEANWKFDPCSRLWSWKGEPFHEKIFLNSSQKTSEEGSQIRARQVILPAGQGHNLAWQDKLTRLDENLILWQLDLALFPMRAAATEESTFRALKLSVSRFSQEVWRPYQARSLGVVLHHSDLRLDGFYWDVEQIEQLAGWLEDCQDEERITQAQELIALLKNSSQDLLVAFRQWADGKTSVKQYILSVLSQYWHYLASSLDEDCPVLVHFDGEAGSLTYQLQLLALPIWEHIHLIGKKIHPALVTLEEQERAILPVEEAKTCTLGIVVPHPKHLSYKAASRLADLMSQFDAHGLSYRLVLESQLTTHWSGLEELIVWADYTSELGVRMLRGFQASMGSIHAIGEASWTASLSAHESSPDWLHLLPKN